MKNYFWKCAGAYLLGLFFAKVVEDIRASTFIRTLVCFGGLVTIWLLLKLSEWYKTRRKGVKR